MFLFSPRARIPTVQHHAVPLGLLFVVLLAAVGGGQAKGEVEREAEGLLRGKDGEVAFFSDIAN